MPHLASYTSYSVQYGRCCMCSLLLNWYTILLPLFRFLCVLYVIHRIHLCCCLFSFLFSLFPCHSQVTCVLCVLLLMILGFLMKPLLMYSLAPNDILHSLVLPFDLTTKMLPVEQRARKDTSFMQRADTCATRSQVD